MPPGSRASWLGRPRRGESGADLSPGSWSATLCTLVANLTTGEAVLLGQDAEAVTIPLAGLAPGPAGARRAGASRS
jgi:hypothetical protein